MHTVTVWDIEHNEVSEMLAMLAKQGYQANQHFEFRFYPAFANHDRGLSHRRSAEFSFQDSALATWFSLRYG